MTTDHPLIGKAISADLKRQLDDERQAHLVCIEMRNDAEAERDRLRDALSDLVEAFVNPGDGGTFEDGEVPVLDRARRALGQLRKDGKS